MKAREKTRPELAGEKMGHSIIEMIHLMYQNRTALWFLWGLLVVLVSAFEKRRIECNKQYHTEIIPKEWLENLKGDGITAREKEKVFNHECPDCGGQLINSRRGMEETRICNKCKSVFILVPRTDIKRG